MRGECTETPPNGIGFFRDVRAVLRWRRRMRNLFRMNNVARAQLPKKSGVLISTAGDWGSPSARERYALR